MGQTAHIWVMARDSKADAASGNTDTTGVDAWCAARNEEYLDIVKFDRIAPARQVRRWNTNQESYDRITINVWIS